MLASEEELCNHAQSLYAMIADIAQVDLAEQQLQAQENTEEPEERGEEATPSSEDEGIPEAQQPTTLNTILVRSVRQVAQACSYGAAASIRVAMWLATLSWSVDRTRRSGRETEFRLSNSTPTL